MSYIRQLLIRQALSHKTNRPSGLIGQYKPYLNSNDSPTRDILKDYSGQGHDIQLYNFGWVEESGYSTTNYPGALVSDGVDDYGICENFPILTKEKGYTVVAVRKWLNEDKGYFISKAKYNTSTGAFIMEGIRPKDTYSFGKGNGINNISDVFTYQSSTSNNGKNITPGNAIDNEGLVIFNSVLNIDVSRYSSIALYALEIYDRDLTDEEIESVKEAMIKEYEEATNNKLEGV